MADAFTLSGQVIGRRLALPGYFAAPILVEDAQAESAEVLFLRVRTADGSLAEVPVPADLIEDALQLTVGADLRLVRPEDLFLRVESARIRLAFAFDPYFAVSLSGIEALPHQLEAVYEHMLPQTRLRFLLADDPGAGKTIMAGLLIKELKLRGALDRVLIVCPAPLTIQWQDEMRSKFEETFEIVGAELAKNTLAGNVWDRFDQIITSLDFAKQPDVRDAVVRGRWDLVVVDEAHKCSAFTYGREVKKTRRYEFAEMLSRETDRLLLMTATPHQGDTDQFANFLKLVDEDQFVGLDLDRELIQLHDSPWFHRRIKEELVDFDGRPLLPPRLAVTQPFELSASEKALYDAVTDYINTFLPRQTGRRRNSVALARSVLQRRLASSLGAIEATLANRKKRFDDILDELEGLPEDRREKRLREMRLLDVDEELESDDEDVEAEDDLVAAASAAERIEDLRGEVARLGELVEQAQQTRKEGDESKLKALRRCLDRAEFGELKDGRGRLLIFTEYRATQDHLVKHLEDWGYTTCVIHGGMNAQQRKDAQILFQRERQIMVATEAAGEGINLQFCHLMINYDLPWNPNRLEQRMGRIHRIGQKFHVTVFNFLAENTVEGRILLRLLVKLDEIRRAMGNDRVFDVVGTLLNLNDVNLEDMLREAAYNPARLEDFETQIRGISMERLQSYEEATGVALAHRQVSLDRVRPKDWRSEERRLMPEYVERFFVQASDRIRMRVEPRADGLWRVEHVPQRLRAPSVPAVQRFGPPDREYLKLTFRKEHLREDKHLDAELLSPGHPLFAAAADVLEEHLADARQAAAAFVDPTASSPYRLYFFELRVLGEIPGGPGGASRPVPAHGELACVLEDDRGTFEMAPPDILHDLTPSEATAGTEAPSSEDIRRAERWVQVHRATRIVEERREERTQEVAVRREFLERSFHELVRNRRNAWAALAARVAAGDESFRLARDEAQRALEETERRRDQKLAELGHLDILRPGPAVYLGCALVRPVDDPEVARRARTDPEVERIAMEIAMRYEEDQGWDPLDVSQFRDGSGFDIRSVRRVADGHHGVRRIEVKGRSGSDATVMLTPNEWTQARRHGETYWLYVVTGCGTDSTRLLRVQDPFRKLSEDVERLTVVKGFQLPGNAVEWAAEGG
ncbi:MAG: helicase-related protein [Actinomycetota bacterium]